MVMIFSHKIKSISFLTFFFHTYIDFVYHDIQLLDWIATLQTENYITQSDIFHGKANWRKYNWFPRLKYQKFAQYLEILINSYAIVGYLWQFQQ